VHPARRAQEPRPSALEASLRVGARDALDKEADGTRLHHLDVLAGESPRLKEEHMAALRGGLTIGEVGRVNVVHVLRSTRHRARRRVLLEEARRSVQSNDKLIRAMVLSALAQLHLGDVLEVDLHFAHHA